MMLSKPWEVKNSNIDIGNGKTDNKELPGHPQYFLG